MSNAFAALGQEACEALRQFQVALEDPEDFVVLMADLGWDLAEIPAAIAAIKPRIDAAVDFADREDLTGAQALALFAALADALDAIDGLRGLTPGDLPASIDAAAFVAEMPGRLIEFLAAEQLLEQTGDWGTLLKLAGIVHVEEIEDDDPVAGRVPHTMKRVAIARLFRMLGDPQAELAAYYRWGHSDFEAERLAENIADVIDAWQLPLEFDTPDGDLDTLLTDGATDLQPVNDWILRAPFLRDTLGANSFGLGVGLFLLPETATEMPGFAVLPFAQGMTEADFDLSDTVSLQIAGTVELTGGVGFLFRPGRDPEFLRDLIASAGAGLPPGLQGDLAVRVVAEAPDGEPTVLLGEADGSRLEVKTLTLELAARASDPATRDIRAEARATDAKLVIRPTPGDTDSFLSSLLPDDGIEMTADLSIGISSRDGVYLGGTPGLSQDLPVHADLGPVRITAARAALRLDGDAAIIAFRGSFEGKLGPASAAIEDVGFFARFEPREDGTGNLAILDADFGFEPPTGGALSIQSPGVAGGGQLTINREAGRYDGALHLRLLDRVDLTAICLIDTRSPEIPGGFSLLVSLAFEWSPPLPLILGLTLKGIGGLFGYNRTIDVERLRSGLRDGSLDTILFPRNPGAELPRLVRQIRGVFPPARDSLLIGPVVKLGWGSPSVADFTLGLIVEAPASNLTSPRRIVIVGQVLVSRPKARPTVRLRLDGLGVIDIERGRYSVDLTLWDSEFLGISVHGDAIYRSNTGGADPFSGLSVGGFHPAFRIPAGLPRLRRLTMLLTRGDNPRLRLEAYFAITSNTLQFGARADFYYSKAGFTVEAMVGLDVLINRETDEWLADFALGATVKWRGRTLLGVMLEGSLGGNAVLFVRGKAKVKIWIWSKSFSVDRTIRRQAAPELPRPVDPMPELLAALADPANWTAGRPQDGRMLVRLGPTGSTGDVVAHPLARIGVRQQVVPLGIELGRFKGARPSGATRFDIRRVLVDAAEVAQTRPVEELFAPGEFLELSDDERLSRPSFERMGSGVEVVPDAVSFADAEDRAEVSLGYETLVIDSLAEASSSAVPGEPASEEIIAATTLGRVAMQRAAIAGAARNGDTYKGVAVAEPTFAVARRTDLTPEDGVEQPPGGIGFTAAQQALKAYVAEHPDRAEWVQVVAATDLEDAA